MDTIYALSTAPGRAGVAVIRVSGSAALAVFGRFGVSKPPTPRLAMFASLIHPDSRELIDSCLALYFPAPHSFTGEDVVELQIHGSRAVIDSVFDVLASTPNMRPASAGEFTRRALMNGKMDLAQVEGLADLIDAETSQQHKQALHFMQGKTSVFYEDLRGRIIRNLAHLEAYIDFPDEDIPSDVFETLNADIRLLVKAISSRLSKDTYGERIRDGFMVTIAGAPNVGKSSLLNALAKRDVAIVSHHAGTTRDVLEVQMNIAGYPVILADTAGIREQAGEIEQEGIRRTFDRLQQADLTLLLFDATDENPPEDIVSLRNERTIVVVNKCDLAGASHIYQNFNPVCISAEKGEGFEELYKCLETFLSDRFPSHEPSVISRARHRQALEAALNHLQAFEFADLIELKCEELRRAAQEIGRVTGKIDIETILDEIFRSFCIGK